MKKLLFLFTLTLLCFAGKAQVKVGADNSFQAPLKDYKTYSWSQDIDRIPQDAIFVGANGILVYNNETTRGTIKKDIANELESKGYKYVPSGGDMFVIFTVTENPGTLRTYNGYQMIDMGLDSVRTPENVEHTKIEAGTLIINLIDSKSGKVAWQGYASGLMKADMINDDMKVREAVASIFNEFKYGAS